MSQRPLSAEEAALWARVAASVKPTRGRLDDSQLRPPPSIYAPLGQQRMPNLRHAALAATNVVHSKPPTKSKPTSQNANTLDANWDKRLTRGVVSPDFTIDLHEHNLASAHARLEGGLALAVGQGARIVLLITGKARHDNPRMPPTARGVIRASIQDWLAGSRWAHHIAAIRNAHPRHGGAGALYLILKRPRG